MEVVNLADTPVVGRVLPTKSSDYFSYKVGDTLYFYGVTPDGNKYQVECKLTSDYKLKIVSYRRF